MSDAPSIPLVNRLESSATQMVSSPVQLKQEEPDLQDQSKHTQPNHLIIDAERATMERGKENLCLFVANLPINFSNAEIECQLKAQFEHDGQISYTIASRDGRGRPYCFVQFADGGSANIKDILAKTYYLGGRPLRIEMAKSRMNSRLAKPIAGLKLAATRHQESKGQDEIELRNQSLFPIHVANLNTCQITQRKLLRRFQKYGRISDIQLFKRGGRTDETNYSSFANIYFADQTGAEEAVIGENGKEWHGAKIHCQQSWKRPQACDQAAFPPHPSYYYQPQVLWFKTYADHAPVDYYGYDKDPLQPQIQAPYWYDCNTLHADMMMEGRKGDLDGTMYYYPNIDVQLVQQPDREPPYTNNGAEMSIGFRPL